MSKTAWRGFFYPLEPVRRQRAWTLDAALADLGRVNRRLADKHSAAQALQEQYAAQTLQLSQNWTARPDPVANSRGLQYLASMHARGLQIEGEIAALDVELQSARQRCASRQRALEVLDKHRAEMLESFAVEKARQADALADADWIARQIHRTPGEPENDHL